MSGNGPSPAASPQPDVEGAARTLYHHTTTNPAMSASIAATWYR